MKKTILYKLKRLKNILREMDSCLIAYSGGVDSSLLLKVAKDTLDKKVLAATAVSWSFPQKELKAAKKICKRFGVRQLLVKTKELENPAFQKNSAMRCYFCKRELFSKLKNIARRHHLNYVIDGSNRDDLKDFRPGVLAKKRLAIRSPLQEANFSKREIRLLSKQLRLPTWDKPALACLASRVSYGGKITKAVLIKIDRAENYIRTLGFPQVRVRDYGNLARIEVEKKDISRLMQDHRMPIARYLKRLGYLYVSIDLEGYRSGSLNLLTKKNKDGRWQKKF